ncbi:hypothetical protein [Nocardia farcinica]|uniref:hypothetical protein n=1 Tax=Nocardia farcinica TaxID=37329 RepID=UPI0024590188|nr:hypothetical protein [Nocardia farcinica]
MPCAPRLARSISGGSDHLGLLAVALDEEERRGLPLVEQVMTVRERAELAENAR